MRAREEAARLKDDFLSAAAHDLKTPLTTVIAQAQLLERRAERHPESSVDRSGLQRIVRESKRLNTLVLELLDASRLERGQLLGPREETDLAALAEEVGQRTSSGRHPCTVMRDGPLVGLWDRVRIAQVVENLVENAVKYSPAGGEIAVHVWQEEGAAHLTARDQGIGIPAADLPHISERFHRGANVDDRSFSGMGLGLFLCRGIVEQHGGRIEVTSAPGKGRTATSHHPAAYASRRGSAAAVSNAPSGSRTIAHTAPAAHAQSVQRSTRCPRAVSAARLRPPSRASARTTPGCDSCGKKLFGWLYVATRGASTAICGGMPWAMTLSRTWSIAWTWTSPPGVPKGITQPSGRRASAGLGVSRGRLPGAIALGWSGSNQDWLPRGEITQPTPGGTGPLKPSLGVAEKTLPRRSTTQT